ncbi:MAG: CYTH and CHAD domain-containing protein [Acidimicrobiia bacterium]
MLERELKFSPGPSFDLPDLDDADAGLHADAATTSKLVASYYDTPDLRLARAGASLRHRNDEGWMVKLPVSRGEGLERHEQLVPGDTDEPPDEALALVRALSRSAPLQLIARLNTLRRRVIVRDASGAKIAEVDDDEVSVIDGVRLAARFRELEVELTEEADEGVATLLGQRLQKAGAGRPDPVPKIVRAIGPRALDAPDLVAPRKLDLASTALEVLSATIASSVARLVDHHPGVLLGDDAEAVHQARVATRRLRSDLRTFRDVVDPHWSEPLRDELKWLGERLGEVRDADVLLERLEARLDALPHADANGATDLLDALRAQRASARDTLLVAMASDRYLSLLDRLVDATHNVPAAPDAADVDDIDLETFVRRPWKKLRRAVDALDDDPPDAELHEVRIRAKRARYATEAVAPAIGREAKRFAKRVAAVQDTLGEHQDAVVAEEWLRNQLGAGSSGPMLFVAGELAAIERAAARAARSRFPSVWRRARRKRLRDWL